MAVVYYWLGDASETTATVVVRSDTAGSLTLTGATNDGPIAVDPAVEYGVVKFTASGLSADTSYPFTLLLDAVAVATGTLRTMPAAGSWKFGFGSCAGRLKPAHYGYQLVADHDIRAWFALGDTPYADEEQTANALTQTRWQQTATIPSTYTAWATGRAAWDAQYAHFQQIPGWAHLTERVPTYRMPDDHEYGNDWDWSTDNIANFTAMTLQSEIDTAGGYANQAAWTWNKGNPANVDTEALDWKPSSCADAASNHPPKYYRKTIGNVEFFHLDCFAHRDAYHAKAEAYRTVCDSTWNTALGYTYSNPSGAALAKTLLGPHQLTWLLNHLASSTATFKVILSGKTTFRALATSDNEGWNGYATERDYILAFIRKYVTGVLWCTGDVHTPSVFSNIAGHACVNGSPLGQIQWLDGSGSVQYPKGYTESMIWRGTSAASAIGQGLNYNGYAVVEVTTDYLHPMIYAENGTLQWEGYLVAGKNYLQPSLEHTGEWS